MKHYLQLGQKILSEGERVITRTGATYSLTGQQLSFNLSEGFPLLTTKKINFNHILHEVLWYLKGTSSIEYLHEHNIKIWDNWAVDNDIGKTYGYQWRQFNDNKELGDQYSNVIHLLKTQPESRRIMINGWNPLQLHEMNLPPCIINLHFLVRNNNKLDLVVYQRSADYCLGVPYDIAEMALILHIVAHETNMTVNNLTIFYGDVHIYENHVETFELLQAVREPKTLPKLIFNNDYTLIKLEDYNPHDKINYPISI